MKKNGAEVVHFATGLVVGYPQCPRINYFVKFIKEMYGMDVVVGTHPIPQKYYTTHESLKTWDTHTWQELIKGVIFTEEIRMAYD